jgi:hypothetical protein
VDILLNSPPAEFDHGHGSARAGVAPYYRDASIVRRPSRVLLASDGR